ncbi:hypothetical protein [Mycobacterium sp.]|uniref:hypothetical protein n=1 Tax=Mycobacterium sp. TaxID=1785 RepID=UPI0025CF43B1|nr:hypothetical protein [Mycobacterium sp.]
MPNNWNAVATHRSVIAAMIGFVAAFALHGIDHFRRGTTASPPAVMVGGTIQGLIVAVALVLVLRNHPWAARAAIVVGFGSAILFAYAHVLPTFLPDFQDSFTSGPRINVTWFSWLTAAGEIGAGLILGFVGLKARRRPVIDPPAQLRHEIV